MGIKTVFDNILLGPL